MSFTAMTWAWSQTPTLEDTEGLLLLRLAWRAPDDVFSLRLSCSEIAADINRHRSTVMKVIESLESKGLISVVKRAGTRSLITLKVVVTNEHRNGATCRATQPVVPIDTSRDTTPPVASRDTHLSHEATPPVASRDTTKTLSKTLPKTFPRKSSPSDRRHTSAGDPIVEQEAPVIPTWMPTKEWNDYLEVRRKKRAFPTVRATELLIEQLDGFRIRGISVAEVLNRSVMSNWTGLFEPNSHRRTSSPASAGSWMLSEIEAQTGADQ